MAVRGAKETARNFRRLASPLRTAANAAARDAMTPMLTAARKNARDIKDTGALAKSLTKKQATKRRDQVLYIVGPRSDYEGPDGRKPVKYAHLAEWGRAPGADGTSAVAGHLWLTRAFEATRELAAQTFALKLYPNIEKQIAKAIKRTSR